MSNFDGSKQTATSAVAGKKAPAEGLLIDPLSSPTTATTVSEQLGRNQPQANLLASSSSSTSNNKENNQVLKQQSPKLGDKKQQSSSSVRNTSPDLPGSGGHREKEVQHRSRQVQQAEFIVDESIRSQASASTPSRATTSNNRRSSPPSGQLFSSSHHQKQQQAALQQQQQQYSRQRAPNLARNVINDSGIEVSSSTCQSEAQRLLESSSNTNNNGKCNCCHKDHLHRNSSSSCDLSGNQRHIANMSLASQTIKLVPAYFIAEMLGTFLLVLIGDGAVAAYVVTKRQVDVFCVCFAFGVGAMIASFVGGKISGAQLNPAASVALALDSRLKWELVPVYMVAQYVGGFLAALVLFLNYSEAINALDGGQRSAFGADNSTGNIFATYPAAYVTPWGSLLDQIVGTAVLLFALQAVGDRKNMGLEERFQPPIVALVVGLVCLAFSPNCGAIFNPARDLSPRLLTAIFGYPGVWSPVDGTYWVLAGLVGPHIGAVLGVFGYKYLIGTALEANKRHLHMLHNSVVISSSGNGETITSNSFDEKKGARVQVYNQPQHQHHGTQMVATSITTTPAPRRQELSDYGSAVMRP